MKLRYLAMVSSCLCLATAGCEPKKGSAQARTTQSAQAVLFHEMSGVWRTDANELIMIDMANGRLQMLVDDTFVPVQVGDIDEENESANLKLRMADGRDAVWTLRKIKEAESRDDAFHLTLFTHEGKATELGFVRNISTDDRNRIASLDKGQATQASVLASIVGEPPAAEGDIAAHADAAQAAADAAAQAADAAAAQADALAASAATSEEETRSSSSPTAVTDGDGISYSVSRNDDGIVLESDNAAIYVGVSCDAFSPQYGKATWQWRDGSLTVDFGNRRIVFATPKPGFANATCLG